MKQETLEEFINEELDDVFFTNISKRKEAEKLIEIGAKWQQEHYNQFTLAMDDLKSSREGYLKAKLEYELKQQEISYSEEEVMDMINDYDASQILFNEKYTYNVWFEQFKKK